MIALDTNVLVRIVLQDDEAQARAAERLFVRARRDRTPLFVADVVLCELVWILSRRAAVGRADIAEALERLLRTELITLEDAAVAERALEAYRAGRGDFADYIIRERGRANGANEAATFDRVLKSDEGFKILSS